MAPPDDFIRSEIRVRPPLVDEDFTRTLLYWMDVEALTPPEAEEDRDTGPGGTFEAGYLPDRDFPWRDAEFGHPDKLYRHFVRFGIFGREAVSARHHPRAARSPRAPTPSSHPRQSRSCAVSC